MTSWGLGWLSDYFTTTPSQQGVTVGKNPHITHGKTTTWQSNDRYGSSRPTLLERKNTKNVEL